MQKTDIKFDIEFGWFTLQFLGNFFTDAYHLG